MPWALLARHAVGRIKQLSQSQRDAQPNYDVAAVILNAAAAKVYATAVGMIRENPAVTITSEDAAQHKVEFSNGKQSAGLTVSALDTHLSQLIVASASPPGAPSVVPTIVARILAVCARLKVQCSAPAG